MKKKFSFILILMFIFNANFSFAEEFLEPNEIKACENFYKAVKNDELPFLKGVYPPYEFNDFGFYYKSIWNTKKREWIEDRDEDGNLQIKSCI